MPNPRYLVSLSETEAPFSLGLLPGCGGTSSPLPPALSPHHTHTSSGPAFLLHVPSGKAPTVLLIKPEDSACWVPGLDAEVPLPLGLQVWMG